MSYADEVLVAASCDEFVSVCLFVSLCHCDILCYLARYSYASCYNLAPRVGAIIRSKADRRREETRRTLLLLPMRRPEARGLT